MYREAQQRLDDAERLSNAFEIGEHSDSPYLLELLGLELLLKLIYEVNSGKPSSHKHEYEKIYNDLPSGIQERLINLAGEWIGPSGLNDRTDEILKEWGKNFIALRYPYEKYKGFSEEQYRKLGTDWLASGGELEKATFRYHPNELRGMLHALRTVANEIADKLFN
jgi:hypothetical protein